MKNRTFVVILVVALALVLAAVALHTSSAARDVMRAIHG
jgi:hypothetical protein